MLVSLKLPIFYIENENSGLPEWVKQGIAKSIEVIDGGYGLTP
ncbi:hypothetical protein [Pragia fontium]|nr:hypothetical protein [Pragia fontium]